MWKSIAVVVALVVLAGCARTVGNFGFGPPPSLKETRDIVNQHLTQYLYYPDRVRDLRIEKPRAGCFYRGIGKRDLCGYQICISYSALNQRGAYVNERQSLWITHGYGVQAQPPFTCPSVLADWDGSEPVALPDFCSVQPEHADCLRGRKESYETIVASKEAAPEKKQEQEEVPSSLAESSQASFEALQFERWRPATEDEVQALANGADRYLKDGQSARYLDVKVGDFPDIKGVRHFCGQVNARNSWGAYGGYTRFYYVEVGFFVMEDEYNGGYFDQKCK